MRTTRSSGGRVPDESGARHERFARAVDGSVGVNGVVRSSSDRSLERELSVVAALRHAGAADGPRPDEVDRMRRRVMAEFADHQPADTRDSTVAVLGAHRARRRAAAEARGRIVVAAAAALCLLMSLSGMSLMLSRDAMPGDALYGFKRTAETAELGLTFGEQSRALKHLEFATSRVNEIEVLAAENSSGEASARYVAALNDFDADAVAGARMLTALAETGDLDALDSLLVWIAQQQNRLGDLRAALPAETGARLNSSLDLLERVEDRAAALDRRAGCENVTSGASDELGPLPSEGRCVRVPLDETASATPLPQDGERGPAAPALPPGEQPAPGTPPAPGAPGVPPAPGTPGAEVEPQRPSLGDVLRPEGDPGAPAGQDHDGDPTTPPRILLPLPGPDLSVPPLLPGLPEVEVR